MLRAVFFCYLEINMINIKCAQRLSFTLYFCLREIYILCILSIASSLSVTLWMLMNNFCS